MIDDIISFFKKKPTPIGNKQEFTPKFPPTKWKEIDKSRPPTDVVIVAFDSTDCGWTMDICYWDKKHKFWRTTGHSRKSRHTENYTHYRSLPKHPYEWDVCPYDGRKIGNWTCDKCWADSLDGDDSFYKKVGCKRKYS